jgi:hypothetical protein
MTRFLRVWLGFLGFTLAMLAVVAVIMLPGAVVIRYTDNLWFALGTTYHLECAVGVVHDHTRWDDARAAAQCVYRVSRTPLMRSSILRHILSRSQ